MKPILLVVLSLIITSCASRPDEHQAQLKEKVSHETVRSGEELNSSLLKEIDASETLSDTKKSDLRKIVTDIRTKNQLLQEETLKLRLVLIKELISNKANPAEVRLIKKDIKLAEAKRLENMFQAVDQISKIVAQDPGKSDFVDHLMTIDRPFR